MMAAARMRVFTTLAVSLVLAACAQSGRNRVPRVEEVRPIGDWLASRTDAMRDKVLRIVSII